MSRAVKRRDVTDIIGEYLFMLPQKTFLKLSCKLYESDFDVTSCVKTHRVMELMQDAATAHADVLGIGWDYMDCNGLFWILSKVKIVFNKPISRDTQSFTLYTWPIASNRLYAERRFEAVDERGETLFGSSSLWMIVERDTRKIASREVVAKYYNFDFDTAECCCDNNFDRVRRDEVYAFNYERQIRRTDLDINKHVNNTNYINYALDVLGETESVKEVEIVYHKELKLGDVVKVYSKRDTNVVYVVGERDDQTCFTVKLTLS